jgi:hypothetical protein
MGSANVPNTGDQGSPRAVFTYEAVTGNGITIGKPRHKVIESYMPSTSGGDPTGGSAIAQEAMVSAGPVAALATGLLDEQFTHVASGGITVMGIAGVSSTIVPIYAGRGGATTAGIAYVQATYAYTGSGTVSIGGIGNTPASASVTFGQWFEWDVVAERDVVQQFEWEFGDAIPYWFEVTSCCAPTTCDRFIVDDGGQCQQMQYTTIIMAPDVESVCEQLTARGFESKVCSISKFSKAVNKTDQDILSAEGVDQSCNHLVFQEFCHIPACLEFCVDYDVKVDIGIVFDTAQSHAAEGGIAIGGAAIASVIFADGTTGFGGVILGGEAEISSSSFGVTALGGIEISGMAEVISQSWSFFAAGGIILGSTAVIEANNYIYEPTGGIAIGGMAQGFRLFVFESTGLGTSGPTFAGVQLGGSAAAEQSFPVWVWEGLGGIEITGTGDIAVGSWEWTNNQFEGVVLGGFADAEFGEGGVSMLADTSLPDATVEAGATAAITYVQVNLNQYKDIDEAVDPNVPTIEVPTNTIKTLCDCFDLPLTIFMRHNLDQTGNLGEFLNRNQLEIPKDIGLSYNAIYKAWQANIHFQGNSADGDSLESWNMVFNWQCSATSGSSNIDSPVWSFSSYINVQNQTTGDDFDSRVRLIFPKEGPCQAGDINFSVQVNTQTKTVKTSPDNGTSSILIYDSIGLFNSPQWRQDPNLEITLYVEDGFTTTTRIPYNPIFAED